MPQGIQESQVILEFLLGLIIFVCLLFLVYVTTRFIGQKASVAMRSAHMKIIETLSLGFDKNIHLIQVGDKYFLIASAGKSIEFLSEVDIEHIKESIGEKSRQLDFYDIFLRYVRKMTATEKVLSDDKLSQYKKNNNIIKNVSVLKKSFSKLVGNYKSEDE
ncbi:MAG: flagellar biosynthetic protein FliO [Clostridia bacterium]